VGKSVNMRELDPADLDKLVSIKGLVTRVTGVTPDMREGRFLITYSAHAKIVGSLLSMLYLRAACQGISGAK